MLKIAVCDDEEYFGKRIETLLGEYFSPGEMEFEVKLFESGEELLAAEKREAFDMIFLDVNMEGMDAVMGKLVLAEKKVRLEFQGKTLEVPLSHIVYVESNLHKLTFYIKGKDPGKYMMYEKLDTIEERFKGMKSFCRIHQSYLVNLKYVEDIKRYQVTLNTGMMLNIAKPRYKDVETQYISYKGEI